MDTQSREKEQIEQKIKSVHIGYSVLAHVIRRIKGSEQLCKVVELSMQCCGKFLSDSFETY